MKPRKYPAGLIAEEPKSPSKKVSIIDENEIIEAEEFLYHKPATNKRLLTANLNLVDIVNTGGNLFFDCPPIVYDERKKNVQEYYTCVDS